MKPRHILLLLVLLFSSFLPAEASAVKGFEVAGIPVEFIVFALTLLGIALFHHHTLKVAVTGLVVVSPKTLPAPPALEAATMAAI